MSEGDELDRGCESSTKVRRSKSQGDAEVTLKHEASIGVGALNCGECVEITVPRSLSGLG